MSDVKKVAQKQAEEAYVLFHKFMKIFSYVVIVLLIAVTSCSFGVDGTGGKSDPSLYEEYKDRMDEMKQEIKEKKYGRSE